jgi:hypothetical protein
MTTEDRLKALRDKLFLACEEYDADETIRAMASAMTTLSSAARRTGTLRARRRRSGATLFPRPVEILRPNFLTN